jgi:hypothetical protein
LSAKQAGGGGLGGVHAQGCDNTRWSTCTHTKAQASRQPATCTHSQSSIGREVKGEEVKAPANNQAVDRLHTQTQTHIPGSTHTHIHVMPQPQLLFYTSPHLNPDRGTTLNPTCCATMAGLLCPGKTLSAKPSRHSHRTPNHIPWSQDHP